MTNSSPDVILKILEESPFRQKGDARIFVLKKIFSKTEDKGALINSRPLKSTF
jgi:hypothetical protein